MKSSDLPIKDVGGEKTPQASTSISKTNLPITDFLQKCQERFSRINDGAPADYIPELAKVDPSLFGIAVTTIDGHTHAVGDASQLFTIQSVSKAFVYAMAIEICGQEEVAKYVGVEPSGEAFNSIRLSPDNRPFNPMVNAGAITCSALIFRQYPEQAFDKIREFLGQFAARDLEVDENVYQSECDTGDRNRAIAWLLKNNGILSGDVDKALDVYFRQCALLVSARELSVMGATLANSGVNPLTGQQVVSSLTAARTLSVMISSGMYDYSGEWIYRVGLPAKSGVGGGILAALPAQMGLGTFSPNLDPLGNSVRGMKVCEDFSSYFGLHLLERRDDVRNVIAAQYTCAEVHSRVDRRVRDKDIIQKHGQAVRIIELAGALNFISCDYVSRRVFNGDMPDIQIIDFRRVAGISAAAAKVLAAIFFRLLEAGARVVITGLRPDSYTQKVLEAHLFAEINANIKKFTTLFDGSAWAEDQLLYTYGGLESMYTDSPLTSQALLAGLSAQQVNQIKEMMTCADFGTGEKIIHTGDPSDSVYFITKGLVSVTHQSGVRINTLEAGTCFGEPALITPDQVRMADVIADTMCQCQILKVSAFDELNKEDPLILQTILKNVGVMLTERLRQSNNTIKALT